MEHRLSRPRRPASAQQWVEVPDELLAHVAPLGGEHIGSPATICGAKWTNPANGSGRSASTRWAGTLNVRFRTSSHRPPPRALAAYTHPFHNHDHVAFIAGCIEARERLDGPASCSTASCKVRTARCGAILRHLVPPCRGSRRRSIATSRQSRHSTRSSIENGSGCCMPGHY